MAFEQVQGKAPQDGEILRPIEDAQAGIIFPKDDIQRPVKVVFNRPVGADGGRKSSASGGREEIK